MTINKPISDFTLVPKKTIDEVLEILSRLAKREPEAVLAGNKLANVKQVEVELRYQLRIELLDPQKNINEVTQLKHLYNGFLNGVHRILQLQLFLEMVPVGDYDQSIADWREKLTNRERELLSQLAEGQ